MAKLDHDSKSDGLEILSIGALYTGPWDKKYWSSSRGKDRYPYPVGYQALRTHKGLTYKMEIYEGTKGPLFQITSNDKQSASGETPDRAWENFQKKCLSRIKLWHGKRSSGKIDGLEFFGFKNALVQRLLRELVATVNNASDQSSVFTNCNEASPKGHDTGCLVTYKYPDLRSCLEKTTVTGKRSRTSRGKDTKSAFKNVHERCQPPHQGNDAKVLYSATGKMDIDEPLISCDHSNYHARGALQVISNMELGDNVSSSAHELPIKSHEALGNPKTKPCLIQVQSEPPIMEASSLDVDVPKEEKHLDRQCIEVQGVGLPVETEEGTQMVQVIPDLLKTRSALLRDSQDNHVGDLFAPDSVNTQQEIAWAPKSGSCGELAIARNEPAGDMSFSKETINGSHSEEGSYYSYGNSEKSDFDSVDEDITKTMMGLLVPLAVPLFTYSRKRRRKTKPHKNLPSADVKSSAETLACSGSNGQPKMHLSTAINSGVSMMENHRYVVPDSVETDQYDHVANELPPSNNAQAVAAHWQKEKQESDKRGSTSVLNLTEFSSHQNEITGIKENLRYIVPDSVENDQYEDHVANELPPSNNAHAVDTHSQKEKQEPDKRGSSPVLDTNDFPYQNQITGIKENLRYFVPDSVENDQCEDYVANELPPSDNAQAVDFHLKEKQEPDIRGSSPVLDATVFPSLQNQITGIKENLRCFVPDSVENDQYEDYVANMLPPADNDLTDDSHSQKKQESDKRGSSPVLDATDFSSHQNQIIGIKENLKYVVPDSVENDQYEDYVANELPPSVNAQAVDFHSQKKQVTDKRGPSTVLDATNFPSHQYEITGIKENIRYIVSDSVENDQYEDHVVNELPPSDNAEAVAAHLQKENQELDERGSFPVLDATNFSSHHIGIIGNKENLRYIVPDSVENDLFEDHVENELPPDNAEVTATHLQEKQESDKRGPVLDANDLASHQNENSRIKDIFSDDELQKKFDGMSQNDCALALHAAVPCPLSVPRDFATCSSQYDQYVNADKNSKPVENCSKYTDLEITLDCKGPKFISVPEKQQCSPTNIHPKMDKHGVTLSESIICRDFQDRCVPEINQKSGNLVSTNACQVNSFGDSDSCKALFSRSSNAGQFSNLQNDDMEDALVQACVLQDQALSSTFSKNDVQFIDGGSFLLKKSEAYIDKNKIGNQHSDSVYQSSDQGKGSSYNCASHVEEDKVESHPSCLDKQEFNNGIEGSMKLIGCYSHPMCISSVILTRKPHGVYICVSCGLLEEKQRGLFLYKLSTTEPSLGSPCMVGHTSMSLPSLKDEFGREVAVDKSGIQFTPDASNLILADSIRVPYCREKNLHCLCLQCETCCFEENAVKIVQIKLGYVSLVVKLKTIFSVHCIIVCEPDHLIAVDESGRIYIWIMNSTWSEQIEAYVIPSYEFLSSRIVELKRIPKSASMVVGHNGYGEFSLWDIIKRTLVSQFSASASSVIDFLPVSLFKYPSKGLSDDKVDMEGCVRKLAEATMFWFSRHNVANISCPMEGEDIAIWLLVCTSSDTHVQPSCYSSNHHLNSDGCWKLGLLMKNVLTLGAALYSSVSAIGTSSGTGIIGTQGGQVHIWELATGRKLEALHDLEGKEVLHIATDESTSSTVAVAGDGGQLCVYLRT